MKNSTLIILIIIIALIILSLFFFPRRIKAYLDEEVGESIGKAPVPDSERYSLEYLSPSDQLQRPFSFLENHMVLEKFIQKYLPIL